MHHLFAITEYTNFKKPTLLKQNMEKGDWLLIIIIVIILVIIALLTANMDKLFPTPTIKQAIQQAVNVTNST